MRNPGDMLAAPLPILHSQLYVADHAFLHNLNRALQTHMCMFYSRE